MILYVHRLDGHPDFCLHKYNSNMEFSPRRIRVKAAEFPRFFRSQAVRWERPTADVKPLERLDVKSLSNLS